MIAHSFVSIVACIALLVALGEANAADTQKHTIHTEVTTKGTGLGGDRKSATSAWTTVHAPEGYVFVENEVEKRIRSAAGSENRVDVKFDDYVEILKGTDIKQPRTVSVRSHARSPKHDRGARGWTKADVIVRQVKYKG